MSSKKSCDESFKCKECKVSVRGNYVSMKRRCLKCRNRQLWTLFNNAKLGGSLKEPTLEEQNWFLTKQVAAMRRGNPADESVSELEEEDQESQLSEVIWVFTFIAFNVMLCPTTCVCYLAVSS